MSGRLPGFIGCRMNLFKKIVEYFFPIECQGCELSGSYLCNKCLENLEPHGQGSCFYCKRSSFLGAVCQECKEEYELDRLLIATNYNQDVISKLIYNFKFNRVKDISKSLADIINYYFLNSKNFELLKLKNLPWIWISSQESSKKDRGFDQIEEILKNLSFNSCLAGRFEKIKDHKAQKECDKEERKNNLINTLRYKGLKPPARVIIFDDVVTTGSTLSVAAIALKDAGVKEVIGVAIAHEE